MNSQETGLNQTLQELQKILQSVKNPVQDDWDPVRVGLLISKLEYPDLDVEKNLADFQLLVQSLKAKLPPDLPLKEEALLIAKVFSEDMGFRGDQGNYYNYKNSLISEVLLRRKGIPVSLSLVFMGLCRSAGLKAVGVNFPGHFLVQVIPTKGALAVLASREDASDWTKTWYVDCFDGGKILESKDCERRLFEWTRGVVPFTPEALKVSHPVEIVSRVLRNLKAIFAEKDDFARIYWVLTALITVCPGDMIESYRERGLLMARMGRFAMAIADLNKFMENPTDPSKAEHVQRMIRQFESQMEFLN